MKPFTVKIIGVNERDVSDISLMIKRFQNFETPKFSDDNEF